MNDDAGARGWPTASRHFVAGFSTYSPGHRPLVRAA
jgi:hypothetical protein